jgi:hypothetical protein
VFRFPNLLHPRVKHVIQPDKIMNNYTHTLSLSLSVYYANGGICLPKSFAITIYPAVSEMCIVAPIDKVRPPMKPPNKTKYERSFDATRCNTPELFGRALNQQENDIMQEVSKSIRIER